jgi:lipid II:glycine glycyltransferase (peptidoglycan interpeptide bridge formation enzyme)
MSHTFGKQFFFAYLTKIDHRITFYCMEYLTKPYFHQSLQWARFWKSAHDNKHSFQQFSHSYYDITFTAIGYSYPWQFGQSFLYFPRFCSIISSKEPTQQEIQQGLKEFVMVITNQAQGHTFIKIDTGFDFQTATGIQTNEDLIRPIQASSSKLSVSHSQKTLQYLSTMILDSTRLEEKKPTETYLDFYLNNKGFWSKTNENVRRYTKKSSSQDWHIDSSKTQDNFEKFWQVYQHTAQKHDFGIHPKSYFKAMITHDFVRLITLSDDQGVQSVWFGVVFDDTCYYLYGGNTDTSFKKYGQYFIHLVATDLISQEGLMSYDLGGYDPKKGFGKFKEGYRGKIVTALGPIDIILNSSLYNVTTHLIWLAKNMLKKK